MNWLRVFLLITMAVFTYPFVLYPLILFLVAPRKRLRRQGQRRPPEFPPVAMVICALNEEKIIRQKLENCLALEYPREKLAIVVVSDGSTDGTAEVIREYASRGVELIERAPRRGKVANLNEILPSRREEVVVLSDANVLYHPSAVARLIQAFEDPTVGCVSGRVVLTDSAKLLQSPQEDYYSLEWHIQERESSLYSMVGVDGAMYAIRQESFRRLPDDTLIEDFLMAVDVVRRGQRVIFEPEAIGWEKGPATLREEFARRVRIAAGAAQALVRGNGWPFGCPWRFWFCFLSHKLMRWLSPLVGAGILILSALLWPDPLARAVLSLAAVLAGLAALRAWTGWMHRFLDAPFYFLFGQAATALGLLRGATGRQSVLWAKADR